MLLFFDLETTTSSQNRIKKIWFVDEKNKEYLWEDLEYFNKNLLKYDFLVGHNIFNHDLKELSKEKKIDYQNFKKDIIDTLFLSSLFFIERPYHKLLKDYKITKTIKNNPLEDAKNTKKLFEDIVEKFLNFDAEIQNIYFTILKNNFRFSSFFRYLEKYNNFYFKELDLNKVLHNRLKNKVCKNVDFKKLKDENSLFLAYSFSILNLENLSYKNILFPVWIRRNFSNILDFFENLRKSKCNNCNYCKSFLDLEKNLNKFFNPEWKNNLNYELNWKDKLRNSFKTKNYWKFKEFRDIYWWVISQKDVVKTTLDKKDVLVIFPTGGWKSITFQLPALMEAEQNWSLTLIISPLQSLMKDQVDSLQKKWILNSAYINWLLSPLERKEVLEKVSSWEINLLYLAPETLRNSTIKDLLQTRKINRIVIDEAHCFSKWGHDFRTDYMFIGQFVKELVWEENIWDVNISCFTATAKRDVIDDIKKYFKEELNKEFIDFIWDVKRDNLTYEVVKINDEKDRFEKLVNILKNRVKEKTTVIFVRTTKQAQKLSEKLSNSEYNFNCWFYHWKMDKDDKNQVQESFIEWKKQIIIATNAFWMWVDKDNVRFVIHYEISSSIENYIQEAWRAWRDWKKAECIILYNKDDLDKNFRLIKSSEIDDKEIKSILSVLKKQRKNYFSIWPKEIAKKAGFDTNENDYENKIKTALYLLEKQGFIKRLFNKTRIFATSKQMDNLIKWFEKIDKITNYTEKDKEISKKILKEIFNWEKLTLEDIVNVIADDFDKEESFRYILLQAENYITKLREIWILEKDNDLNLIFNIHWWKNKSLNYINLYQKIFDFIIEKLKQNYDENIENNIFDLKEINKELSTSVRRKTCFQEIEKIIYYLQSKKYLRFKNNIIFLDISLEKIKKDFENVFYSLNEIIKFSLENKIWANQKENSFINIETSILEIQNILKRLEIDENINIHFIEKILLFWHKLEILKVDSGIFVYQTFFKIQKKDRIKDFFRAEDYEILKDFYKSKINQVHFLGEYIEKLEKNNSPSSYIKDYFIQKINDFKDKYFKNRKWIIDRPITNEKYEKIVKDLTEEQKEIIKTKNKNILVLAWPGSWKTRVLVHKVASLILLDWVKLNQFLMLSFSRTAKQEIKERLKNFLWNEAFWLEIETFHSYSFKKLWLKWDLQDRNIIKKASEYIKEQEENLSYKFILVDEFQDIDKEQFELIKAIKEKSDANIIAVWDDDQNIYEFRWSEIWYIKNFEKEFNAEKFELSINFRSNKDIVNLTNSFIEKFSKNRLKKSKIISYEKKENQLWLFENNSWIIQFYDWKNLFWIIDKILKIYKNKNDIWIFCFTNEKALQIKKYLDDIWEENEIILSDIWYKIKHLLELNILLKTLKFRNKEFFEKGEVFSIFTKIKEKYWINKNTKKLDLILDKYFEFRKKLYLQSFIDFIKEIEIDEYLEEKRIKISTLHKTKWKEFESIAFIFDENFWVNFSEEQLRLVYVWLTRAKNDILCFWIEDNIFYKILKEQNKNYFIWKIDNKQEKNSELTLFFWLKDVNIWWNKWKNIKNFNQIWEEVFINDELWAFKNSNWKIIQAISRKWKEKLKKYLSLWYEIEKIFILNRLVYSEDKNLVYVFSIDFIKNI